MAVRKFYATTLGEALRSVKRAFGPDAVILSTRQMNADECRPGDSGKAHSVEVVASDDVNLLTPQDSHTGAALIEGPGNAPGVESPSSTAMETAVQALDAAVRKRANSLSAPDPNDAACSGNGDEDVASQQKNAGDNGHSVSASDSALMRELSEMHAALRQLMEGAQSAPLNPGWPQPARALREHLRSEGFDTALINDLLESLARRNPEGLEDPQWLDREIRRTLHSMLHSESWMTRLRDVNRALGVTGPSGVGKSSLIAKIATMLVLNFDIPTVVGVANLHGEPASSLLATACRLSKIPVYAIENKEDIDKFINVHGGKSKVLLDLGPTPPGAFLNGATLASLFGDCSTIDTLLTLSSGTKTEDLTAAAEWANRTGVDGLAFTMLDETATVGGVFEASRLCEAPIAFFSESRRIPEGLIFAQSENLVERALSQWQERL